MGYRAGEETRHLNVVERRRTLPLQRTADAAAEGHHVRRPPCSNRYSGDSGE